jgi:hypothetical protein
MLETQLATMETRFVLEGTRVESGESSLALAARVTALERALGRLSTDLQRVEREAAQARRDASAAQQAARDAAMRSR